MKLCTVLKQKMAQTSLEREFHLQGELQVNRKEDCPSLGECLLRFKTIVDEVGAIGKPLNEERKCFLMLQGLGNDYQMFTTLMLRPPMPPLNELMDMLMSYESRILKPMNQNLSSNQLAYVAQKSYRNPQFSHGTGQNFSSQNRGFQNSVVRDQNEQLEFTESESSN